MVPRDPFEIVSAMFRQAGEPPGRLVSCLPVDDGVRHSVWRIRTTVPTRDLFLKIPVARCVDSGIEVEAAVLAHPALRQFRAPTLMCVQRDGSTGAAILLTRALAGVPLNKLISAISATAWKRLCLDLCRWLAMFHSNAHLARMLRARSETWCGPYDPTFDAVHEAHQLCALREADLDTMLGRGWREALPPDSGREMRRPTDVVHGDLGPGNVIAVQRRGAAELSGVVDFESVRLGDGMWDVSMMAMRLLQDGKLREAAVWRDTAHRTWGSARLSEQVPGMLVWLHVSRFLAAKLDTTIDAPSSSAVLAEATAYLGSSGLPSSE